MTIYFSDEASAEQIANDMNISAGQTIYKAKQGKSGWYAAKMSKTEIENANKQKSQVSGTSRVPPSPPASSPDPSRYVTKIKKDKFLSAKEALEKAGYEIQEKIDANGDYDVKIYDPNTGSQVNVELGTLRNLVRKPMRDEEEKKKAKAEEVQKAIAMEIERERMKGEKAYEDAVSKETKKKEKAQEEIDAKLKRQQEASTGYQTKSRKDADAYANSLKRQGYNVITTRLADGTYKINAMSKEGRSELIKEDDVRKEQLAFTKKEATESFFPPSGELGRQRIVGNIRSSVKKELGTVIPETVKAEMKSTMNVSSQHANIRKAQVSQLRGMEKGKHPMIGTVGEGEGQKPRIMSEIGVSGISGLSDRQGEEEVIEKKTLISGYSSGKKPNIMSETGVGNVGEMSSGNIGGRRRKIAMLPTTKIDFTGG